VCVTKFDEVPVYKAAQKLNLIVSDPADPHDFPHVPDEDARELFIRLCEASGTGNAEMVVNALEKYFRPERIKYFVTSAVGFYLDPRTPYFDEDDWQNVVESESTERKPGEKRKRNPSRIRGGIYPINVIEPVTWLCRQILSEPARPGK
jgi:hypothetical protein